MLTLPPRPLRLTAPSLGLADNSFIQLPWAEGVGQSWQAAQNRGGGQAFHSSLPHCSGLSSPLFLLTPLLALRKLRLSSKARSQDT